MANMNCTAIPTTNVSGPFADSIGGKRRRKKRRIALTDDLSRSGSDRNDRGKKTDGNSVHERGKVGTT